MGHVRILIIGAGAVGSLMGARLARAGHPVMLVGRQAFVNAVQAGGLTLVEPNAEETRVSVAAANSIRAAFASHSFFDLGLLTVKAYDTAAAIAELGAVQTGLPLLTLQNGLGNEEALADAFGADRVIAGAIDTPVSVPKPGWVLVHRRRYKLGLAPVGKNAPLLTGASASKGAGFDVQVFGDYRSLKWTKLMMNILANATCAILDWTPAQVMDDPVTARLEAVAWQEAMTVMVRLHVRPVMLAGYPFPLLAPLARVLPAEWLARGLRLFVKGGRGGKLPSLQQALDAHKPSEVRWLNGAVADSARKLGVRAPVNEILSGLLTQLTAGAAAREQWRNQPARLAAMAADALHTR